MNIWRVGSNWGRTNLISIFKEKKIAFAGLEVKNQFTRISKGDIVVITNGKPLIGIGVAQGIVDLSSFDKNLADEFEYVKAVKLDPLYWQTDFSDLDWGIYDGRGKQFHRASGQQYVKQIKKLYQDLISLTMNSTYTNELLAAKNIVLTGAPGTGKTFLAKQIAEDIILTKEKLDNIVGAAFDTYRNFAYDPALVDRTDANWQYWKARILADDFNLDDFANTIANAGQEASLHGSYLMNFLERTSKEVYGSSKPGNAYNYGVKMNGNRTYGIGHSDEEVDRQTASAAFEHEIKSWFQGFLQHNFDAQQQMASIGNNLVRAGQLLRKMVVLEHPTQLLSIYQDKTIENAYGYFVNENDANYFDQNRKLLTVLLDRLSLDRTKENVFKLNKFVWHYFNEKAPGDLKKNDADFRQRYMENYMTMVQFHPSYDYTDFFEGFRPYMVDGQKEVGFKLRNGTFKDFCIKARKSLEQDRANGAKEIRKFVFIIDEINRAEISKVLGELFFAIDPGYRGEKGKIRTQYANMQTAESCFLDPEDDLFYVPENVYIIGTMNDIDRSVESFDFALRRRFAWINIKADDQVGMWNGQIDKWKDTAASKMSALNNAITTVDGLNEAYHIGPAYFLKLNETEGNFDLLWQYHIANVVREYFRGMPDADENLEILKKEYDLA